MCHRWEREHQLPESAAPLIREFLYLRAGDATEDTDDEDSDSEGPQQEDAALACVAAAAVAHVPPTAISCGKRKAVENPNPSRSLRRR